MYDCQESGVAKLPREKEQLFLSGAFSSLGTLICEIFFGMEFVFYVE